MLRRLPRLLLPVLRPQSRKCMSCASFDLQEGQKVLVSNPYFAKAMTCIEPARMGQTLYTPQQEGETLEEMRARHARIEAEQNAKAQKWQWSEMGLCRATDQVVWRGDRCDKWSSSIPGKIKHALFGDDL